MSKKNETLVIGASLKPNRYSNIAIKRLRDNNQPTRAIGLRAGEVEDVSIETSLKDFKNIDTVTLYVNPKRQVDYYDYIIGLQPRRVIFNPGTENPDFYKMLRNNGIEVEVACTLVLLSTNQY
ncbi:CoA-binding protein [Mesonia mobilis]|uniref:CoA-binding protein n=1 Tax=Mesonia mobilis TaxID=369791 RepID=A0ABQ3C3B9_9FLAO|nr:CoA-binding protein [Mesonia mobilis]GGZ64229.1 CoA-binding protein [Mesonia mobilis]